LVGTGNVLTQSYMEGVRHWYSNRNALPNVTGCTVLHSKKTHPHLKPRLPQLTLHANFTSSPLLEQIWASPESRGIKFV